MPAPNRSTERGEALWPVLWQEFPAEFPAFEAVFPPFEAAFPPPDQPPAPTPAPVPAPAPRLGSAAAAATAATAARPPIVVMDSDGLRVRHPPQILRCRLDPSLR
jgi:hypothetical protein